MIVGLERPTAGTIIACGRDRSRPSRGGKERKQRGREVQIVFQDPYSSLDPRQTGADARSTRCCASTTTGDAATPPANAWPSWPSSSGSTSGR